MVLKARGQGRNLKAGSRGQGGPGILGGLLVGVKAVKARVRVCLRK